MGHKVSKKFSYKHIVDKTICDLNSPHPLENFYNKRYFIDQLCKDLGIEKSNCIDISSNKNNLFQIHYQNQYFNIFIEHTDSGGADISFNRTTKKVSITANKAFRKLIDDHQKVLVINLYYPLLKNKEIDIDNRIYLIIKPTEIYKSKVIKTKHPSSRWIRLEEILNAINNPHNLNVINKKENVFAIHWHYIKDFFNHRLKWEYQHMIDTKTTEAIGTILKYDHQPEQLKLLRKLFREILINEFGTKCQIATCFINLPELLIASHIKPVHKIKKDDSLDLERKKNEIKDPNNGFLLCANHDAMFDKYLITVKTDGRVVASSRIKSILNHVGLNEDETLLNIRLEQLKYLQHHNNEFKKKYEY